MIILYKPQIMEEGSKTIIRSAYKLDNKTDYLWFSFSKNYKNYLVTENLDAFVVGLLLLAMKRGEDIELKAPISERLYYTLNHYLINALNLANLDLKKIKILATELNSARLNTSTVAGTGISCGVDSFSTIYDHINDAEPFKIKYYTFLNAGSHEEFGGELSRKIFRDRLQLVKPFADECNIDILTIDTNINEILMMNHQQTHTIRDIACVLNLQKLFKYYYYASAYRFDYFKLNKFDMADYDILLLSMLSTESITFFSAVSQYTRVERTENISNYEPTYRHLNVCAASNGTSVENCSICPKCLRTQLTLDLLGKLHLYNKVFNINKYYQKKDWYIGKVLSEKNSDMHCKEIYDLMKVKKYNISLKSYFYFSIIHVKKRLKKLLKDDVK